MSATPAQPLRTGKESSLISKQGGKVPSGPSRYRPWRHGGLVFEDLHWLGCWKYIFVATVLMDPGREQQYVAGLNIPERLLVGYCFDRKVFPWTAIWEENKARAEAPWHGQSETRGLEFGSTPLQVGRREAFANGPLFGAPSFSIVPALGRATVRYVAFLTQVPAGLDEVGDIRLANREILVVHPTGRIRVPASGVSESGVATE